MLKIYIFPGLLQNQVHYTYIIRTWCENEVHISPRHLKCSTIICASRPPVEDWNNASCFFTFLIRGKKNSRFWIICEYISQKTRSILCRHIFYIISSIYIAARRASLSSIGTYNPLPPPLPPNLSSAGICTNSTSWSM